MFQSKNHNLLIGFTISVLLSLFVNFSLLMRSYEESSRNVPAMDFGHFFLYFSLLWYFIFAFLLFIINIQMYSIGERIFHKKEYKSTLLAVGVSLLFAVGVYLSYPIAQHAIIEDLLEEEIVSSQSQSQSSNSQTARNGFPPGSLIQEARHNGEMGPKEGMPGPEMMAPRADRPGRFNGMKHPPMSPEHIHGLFTSPYLTEHSFILLSMILSVMLFRLLLGKQKMRLEFEQLKTEKLQNSYNALMGQINPHFFFNSLNGLNSLIREGEQDKTLTYLDELSNVFRYILQSNKKEMVTLAEELEFVRAYTYLLQVRYEGKLFFNTQADSRYLLWYIPILSILPLIENAVKHNVISKQYPLQIDIYTTNDDELVISNHIQPKVEDTPGSGIGLKNLWGRFQMLTGKDIKISDRQEYFKVTLPLLAQPINREI